MRSAQRRDFCRAQPVQLHELRPLMFCMLWPLHEEGHRWIFFPKMTRDEVLLLKVFDSRRDGRARFGCHCAFQDPLAEDLSAHRESIETRCLVILPKGVDDVPSFTVGGDARL